MYNNAKIYQQNRRNAENKELQAIQMTDPACARKGNIYAGLGGKKGLRPLRVRLSNEALSEQFDLLTSTLVFSIERLENCIIIFLIRATLK